MHVFEAGAVGLAAGFRDGRGVAEKFYHHFANDDAILDLIAEAARIKVRPRPTTSLWLNGSIYPMDRPNIVTATCACRCRGQPHALWSAGLYLRFTRNWRQ